MQSNRQPLSTPSPVPRSGAVGWLDRLVGPGSTRAEWCLHFAPAIVAAVVAPLYAATLDIEWSVVHLALIAFLAFDLLGGVLTNSTTAGKRWVHRPGQGWRQHLGFVAIHLAHVTVVAVLFRAGDAAYVGVVGGYLIVAAMLILASPLYLRRPIGLGLYALALIGSEYIVSPTPGLEWFLPLFFLKLLVSHLLRETPYRPDDSVRSMSVGKSLAGSSANH